MADQKIILEMKHISKNFGAVRALENVDFEVYENEILALLGDNGAGKSTLIKIISGVHSYDEGEMWIYGQKASFRSPEDARKMGIETIYQDLALFDNLDLSANVFAGREKTRQGIGKLLGIADRKAMHNESKAMLDRLGIGIADYWQEVGNYSGGQRQSIAIAKAIYWGHRIIIMDEPTAALGVRETEGLFQLIDDLKAHNVTIIVIMHNLEQVLRIADRAIVLRRGKRVGMVDIREKGPGCYDEIAKMLI